MQDEDILEPVVETRSTFTVMFLVQELVLRITSLKSKVGQEHSSLYCLDNQAPPSIFG